MGGQMGGASIQGVQALREWGQVVEDRWKADGGGQGVRVSLPVPMLLLSLKFALLPLLFP